jgi:prepilin-type N-terminal cleavage/methylation domain-containing protein
LNNRRRDRRRVRINGFTLFEVVIALAIAALGLSFMMSAASSGLANAGLANQFISATRLAQSHLAEVGVTTALNPGVRSGADAEGYTWQTRISTPVVQAGPPAGDTIPPLRLYTIDVTVGWRDGDLPRSVSLRSQRTLRQ